MHLEVETCPAPIHQPEGANEALGSVEVLKGEQVVPLFCNSKDLVKRCSGSVGSTRMLEHRDLALKSGC